MRLLLLFFLVFLAIASTNAISTVSSLIVNFPVLNFVGKLLRFPELLHLSYEYLNPVQTAFCHFQNEPRHVSFQQLDFGHSICALMMQAGIADAATAAGYASEASSYSVAASALMEGMSSTLSSLEAAAEALDGAMQAINEGLGSLTSIEMAELTEAGRVFSAYPEVALIGKGAVTEQKPVEERLHFILLEKGFPISIFNIWTFALDQNRGTKTAADASVNDDLKQRGLDPAYGPGYTTRITIPKATLIRMIPFVRVAEQAEMRSPEWYVVPNELTLANIPEERQAPEDTFDWAGHGTDMACLAGGHTFSLAPKSNLYLIKTFNAWLEETDVPGVDDVWTLNRGTPDALHDGYFQIVQIVENRGLQGRAVISNSNGYHYDRYINDESTWQPLARGEGPEMTEEEVKKVIDELADFVEAVNEVYDDIAKAARSNGIIWIQAIGNQGAHLYEDEDPRLVPGVMAAAGDTIPRMTMTLDYR
ncbi:hypothetical protein SLS64_007703 [Diaporthe eres]